MSQFSEISPTYLRKGALAGSFAALALIAAALPVAAAEVAISIKPNNSYDKKSQPVKVGDAITWTNEGGTHTVTPDNGQPDPFPGSGTLNQDATFKWTVAGDPRTIKYHCKIYGPSMSGELVIGR